MAKPLRIGMIGYGFMGRAHSNGYKRVSDFFDLDYTPVLQAVAARDTVKAQVFADRWGYKRVESDWRKLVAADDIDAIDICTPNNLHAEIAIEAAKHGKAILCEKPLAMDVAEGERMLAAIEKAGVPNMVWYNYRRIPAVTFAKQIIDSGKLGRIFHYRAEFLQDWTIAADLPQGGAALWRLDAKAAGSGVTGDLLAHCIDTALWLNGAVTNVTAMTETFVKERTHQLTGKIEPVEIDDACSFLCHFKNGSLGLFESTRYARGHKALYTFEINGENMSLKWDLHDLHRLQVFDYADAGNMRGWKSIHVTDGDHPYMDKWWVPGLAIGYEHSFVHQVADFLVAFAKKQPAHPTFRDALQTQRVCDAVLASAKSHQWVDVG
ncbi:MAG: Gfo/Idh/MocA family oxidoreductase [Planctomycetia bacterium]|nr:Gfo/Idh/MocA family oxidoreductase [Planctomycetia bacterium]